MPFVDRWEPVTADFGLINVHVIKNLSHHGKVRDKRLAKNEVQLSSLLARADIVMAKRRVPAIQTRGTSQEPL